MEYINAEEEKYSSIFTQQPIPRDAKQFYFEVTIDNQGDDGAISIGLVKSDAKHPNGRMVGWDAGTIGYHGDDGGIYHNSESSQNTCATYTSVDTVGCFMKRVIVDGIRYTIVHFTKNGEKLKPVRYIEDGEYYPAIGMGSIGAKVQSKMCEVDYLYKIEGT